MILIFYVGKYKKFLGKSVESECDNMQTKMILDELSRVKAIIKESILLFVKNLIFINISWYSQKIYWA